MGYSFANLVEGFFDIARDSGGIKPSTLQDRLKGKRMEYDAFTGALIRLADKHKIHIPINRSIHDQLKQLDNRFIIPGHVS